MRPIAQAPLTGAALLALVCLGLHHAALFTGFTYDDPIHLQFAATYSPWQYFTDRQVMLQQSYAHITPWNPLFFDIALPWAGLDARWHHAHLLTVIWACACATWLLLRRWIGDCAALYAAVLFLAMPPTGIVASLLMTGHYAYGLLFSILALNCQVLALLRKRMAWSFACAVCYGLACLCKELYVPLVLVLLALPLADRRWRIHAAIPVLAVALAYAGLRVYVLGGLGGYAALSVDVGPPRPAVFDLAARVVQGMYVHVLGPGWVGVSILALAAMVVALGLWRGRRVAPVVLAAVALALLLPVLPAFSFDLPSGAGRVLLVVGWAAAVGLAWMLSVRRGAWVFALALLPLLVVQQRAAFEATQAPARIAAEQYDFLLRSTDGDLLIPFEFRLHGYLLALADAAKRVLGRSSAHIVDDEAATLALGPDLGARAFAWHEENKRIERMGARYAPAAERLRSARRAAAGRPLEGTLALTVRGRFRLVRWDVESAPGRMFMHVKGFERFEAPARGALAFGLDATSSALSDPAPVRLLVLAQDGALIQSQLVSLPIDRSSSHNLHAEAP